MAKHFSTGQNTLDNLFAARDIAMNGASEKRKINLDRIELQLCHASGIELLLGRVHALSAVRRRSPLYLLPPEPSALVGRSALKATLHKSLAEYRVTELNGPDGAGKSTLATALAHEIDLDQFPDGAVYIEGKLQFPDLLQTLFDVFYASDRAVKITPQQAYSYLYNLVALVILDDAGVNPKQIDPVLDALGNATVLLIGPERAAIGRGHAESMAGLPPDAAAALFHQVQRQASQEGSQDYPQEASPVIQQICAQLNNMPLPIATLAAYSAAQDRPLAKIASHLAERKAWAGPCGDLSIGPALEQTILILDEAERQLLTNTAAFAGPSVSSEILRTLTGLSPTAYEKYIERLQSLGLVYSTPPQERDPTLARLAMPSAYRQALRIWLVDDATRQEIVNYYATHLEQGGRLDGRELPNLLGAIQDCGHHGWLEPLWILTQAAGGNLAWLGWWSEWQNILDLARRTAQAQQDRPFEAWAMHQLGSVLGVLGVADRARHLLRSANRMRQKLGDDSGADLSAHNLALLNQLLPATPAVPTVQNPPAPASSTPTAPAKTEQTVKDPSTAPATADPTVTEKNLSPVPSQAASPTVTPVSSPASSKAASSQPGLQRLRRRIAMVFAMLVLALSVVALNFYFNAASENPGAPLSASWEFGNAWNAYDNQTWTQQIVIQVPGEEGDYRYLFNGEPVSQTFEITLPLCEGTQGVIQVESTEGQTTQVPVEFDSPFCR